MNKILAVMLACSASLAFAQKQPPPSAGLFVVDARTPQGLRELFQPTTERLTLLSADRGGAGPASPENCLADVRGDRGPRVVDARKLRSARHQRRCRGADARPDPHHTSNGTGPIKERTLAELRQLRLKDRQGNLTQHRIPTLDEAMEWARGKTIPRPRPKGHAGGRGRPAHHRASRGSLYDAHDLWDQGRGRMPDALNRDIMMEVMLGTRERFEEFDRSGVPWSNIIAFVGHTQTPDADSSAAASGRRGQVAWPARRATLTASSSVAASPPWNRCAPTTAPCWNVGWMSSSGIPRELGPLVFGRQAPAGAKAKFFRVTAP